MDFVMECGNSVSSATSSPVPEPQAIQVHAPAGRYIHHAHLCLLDL